MIERRWEHQLGPLWHPKKKNIWTNGKPSSEFKMILTFCYVVRPSIKVLRWSHGEGRGRKSSISDSRGIKSAYTQLPAYPGSSVWWFAFVWPQRGFWAAESPQIKKNKKRRQRGWGTLQRWGKKPLTYAQTKRRSLRTCTASSVALLGFFSFWRFIRDMKKRQLACVRHTNTRAHLQAAHIPPHSDTL